jgi:cyclic pyranopterin phosphate synthase
MQAMAERIPLRLVASDAQRDRLARPLRDLRISVIDRCNFRCPYCMPEERFPRDAGFLPASQRLSAAEIEHLARVFIGLGVDKLRLTGGEPLLRRDLPEIVARLAALEGVRDLALTTNGVLLPGLADALRAAGLKRLTVSLDALDPALFARMSGGRGSVAQVLAGIAAAERAGFAALKINTVVMRGVNDGEVIALLERFRFTSHVVRLIEYMDVGTCNAWDRALVVPSAELVERISARWPLVAIGRNYAGEVAERYAYADGGGEIGFVSSVTRAFCGDCHRARLSADGALFTCLFASAGTDLRGPLRAGCDDATLRELVSRVWSQREDRYSELRSEAPVGSEGRIEMYRIGG